MQDAACARMGFKLPVGHSLEDFRIQLGLGWMEGWPKGQLG